MAPFQRYRRDYERERHDGARMKRDAARMAVREKLGPPMPAQSRGAKTMGAKPVFGSRKVGPPPPSAHPNHGPPPSAPQQVQAQQSANTPGPAGGGGMWGGGPIVTQHDPTLLTQEATGAGAPVFSAVALEDQLTGGATHPSPPPDPTLSFAYDADIEDDPMHTVVDDDPTAWDQFQDLSEPTGDGWVFGADNIGAQVGDVFLGELGDIMSGQGGGPSFGESYPELVELFGGLSDPDTIEALSALLGDGMDPAALLALMGGGAGQEQMDAWLAEQFGGPRDTSAEEALAQQQIMDSVGATLADTRAGLGRSGFGASGAIAGLEGDLRRQAAIDAAMATQDIRAGARDEAFERAQAAIQGILGDRDATMGEVLGAHELGLASQQQELQELLGLKGLSLDQQKQKLAEFLGMQGLDLDAAGLSLEAMLGMAGVALEGYLGEGKLGIEQQKVDVQQDAYNLALEMLDNELGGGDGGGSGGGPPDPETSSRLQITAYYMSQGYNPMLASQMAEYDKAGYTRLDDKPASSDGYTHKSYVQQGSAKVHRYEDDEGNVYYYVEGSNPGEGTTDYTDTDEPSDVPP